MTPFPISPFSLDTLTEPYCGSFDAAIIAQLAPLAENDCYQPKIYRAPALSDEVIGANCYASYGLKITPGSLIYCFYQPPSSQTSNLPQSFNVQIRDESLKHKWFDQPIPSYFLASCKPSYLSAGQNVMGATPAFLIAPYPVVGNGLFTVEIWETSGAQQRIELIFGVLNPIGGCS